MARIPFLCMLFVLGMLLDIAPASAETAAAQAETAVMPSSLHDYRLDNGLRLVVKEDHRAPVVTVMVWYRVGSVDEPTGRTGLSHVLEHMMFKGSKKLGPGDFSRLVARYGGADNAFTSDDYTAYYQKYEASRLPLALELEAERMQNLDIDEEEFHREVQVVMEERRMRVEDKPNSLAREKFQTVLHGGSGYAHPVIGWRKDLESLTRQQALDWYRKYYQPANATLVVVGDVQPEETRKLVEKFFSNIPAGPAPEPMPESSNEPVGERRVWIDAPVEVPILRMGFNVPSLKTLQDKKDYYAITMLAYVLDGSMSARFEKSLVRKQKVAAGIGAGYSGWSRGDGVFTINAMPAPGITLEQLEQAIWNELDKIKTELASEEEIETIIAGVVSGHVYEADSIFNQAMELGMLSVFGIDLSFSETFIDEVSAITAEDIRAVAKQYLVKERLAVAEIRAPEDKQGEAGEKQ